MMDIEQATASDTATHKAGGDYHIAEGDAVSWDGHDGTWTIAEIFRAWRDGAARTCVTVFDGDGATRVVYPTAVLTRTEG